MLALKVDVDTWRGTRLGVPRLVDLFRRHQVGATFLFSLGPDHTGRAIKRVFRRGFLQKVARTSVVEHYGIRTLLYGTVLPGPDIGKREAATLRSVDAAGFEVGIHTWDHIKWQDCVAGKNARWTEQEMAKAAQRFQQIFGRPAKTHGAAGWQMNPAAYTYEASLGLDYASDGRGQYPFQPVDAQGQPLGVPQLPTTLPTLDELIGCDGLDQHNVHHHLLDLTRTPPATGHVYTLHAELEGLRFLDTLDRLLTGWKEQGYQLVSCASLFAAQDRQALPRCPVSMGEIPGRSGVVAIQG